ncbi:unnamed protein product [Closterium sp. NIES-54]
MFKSADGKMVGLKNVLWVPNLAANLISVRRLQKAGMDTSSKGAKTYTARLGERILCDLHEDRDVYNEMWQIPVVPMPKERQVAASISTKGEVLGSGDGANGRAKEIKSKNCNLGGTSKLNEHEESGAAAKKQHKDEENPMAAAEEEYGENIWGTIASAAFSNPTSATGECDWLTLHQRMGHVALPILQQLVKNEMVAGIRVKGEPDEVLGCPTCMQAKFTCYPFPSSEAMAKAPLDEVVMDVAAPLKLGAAGAEYCYSHNRLESNRTITETARGLLIEARLPDYFWPDAVRSACVAKNRALTHVGADKWVPYVEWIGRKPKVDMLRVFGCMCMALVPKHLRHNKLGAKEIWAVHLGMAHKSKGWLLWDPFTKKFLVRKDCKFMENLMYKDWKAENEAKIGMQFGEVKSSGLEHVELPLKLSSSSTTTRQSSLVNGGEEAKDAEEEDEEVQQVSERAPTLPSRTASAPRIRVTPQQRQGLHSDYEECAFAFFSPVEMPGEPATLKEALESSDAEEWKKAMESELKSIEESGTWELVEIPEGRKAITSKWLFKIKSDADGNIERYKACGEGVPAEGEGFTPSSADHSLFMLGKGEQRSFMVVYVDDILIFSQSSDLVKEVMLKLQDNLMYAAVNTRPDVTFATGQLARVVQCPNEEQVAAGRRVAKYLGQTPTVGLHYSAAAQRRQKGADGVQPGRLFLTAFSDASYASEPEDMTSVGGFICCVCGGPTAWESKMQVDQALSSVESEYMALFRAFYHLTSRRVLSSQDVTFDESMSYYLIFPYRTSSPPPPSLFLSPGTPPVDPLPPQGRARSGVSQVDPAEPVEEAVDSGAESGGAEPAGAGTRGAAFGGAEPGHVEPVGTVSGGAEPARAASGGALGVPARRKPLSPQQLRDSASAGAAGGAAGASRGAAGAGAAGGSARASGGAAGSGAAGGVAGARAAGGSVGAGATGGAGGTAGAGAAGDAAGTGDPWAEGTGSVSAYGGARCELESRPVSPESRFALPIHPVRAGRVSRLCPPPVPGTHSMTLRPCSVPQRVPLPSPPASSLPAGPDPASDSLHAASPAVMRFLATAVTDPLFESTAASALVTELVDFAAA